mmetsp:Transcript_23621/g.74846  ORF Transcript_23621/g.74846 Transcript_23621/m.74846 type:complete len:203 (+) Transcript_23621:374-982(+)
MMTSPKRILGRNMILAPSVARGRSTVMVSSRPGKMMACVDTQSRSLSSSRMLRMSAAARGLCTNPARGGRDQEVQHARGRVAAALRGPLPGHAAPAEVGPPTAANGRPQAPWRQLGSRSPRKSLATPGRKLSRWKMCWAPRSLLEPAVLRAVASPQTADPDTRDVSAKWTASLPGKRASAAAMSKLPTTLRCSARRHRRWPP